MSRPSPAPARSPRPAAGPVPLHLVPGDPDHGVARYAREVASACGARVVDDVEAAVAAGGPVHLHLTDRLLGRTPAAAAGAVERIARAVPLTVTLHDVPQPTDGPGFRARAAAYGRVVLAARGWVTNSHHERVLVDRWCASGTRGATLPLPVHARPAVVPVVTDPQPVLGIFGFVYPGKGHRQVVDAAAELRRGGMPAQVLVVGGPAVGHADELDEVCRLAHRRGVPVEVTGHLPDDAVHAVLRRVAVPVVAHRNVSASGSLNSWLAAGRRPLVRDGAYAREMAALRRGSMTLFRDDTLAEQAAQALIGPTSTWLTPATDLRPHLDDTVAGYLDWWASV